MVAKLLAKSLLGVLLASILASCGLTSDNGVSPSESTGSTTSNTSSESIIPGVTECDSAGDVSPDGKYVCAGRGAFYWVSLQDLATGSTDESTDNSNRGYWTTNCVNVEVPNPNYDPNKGYSAIVNEPTIRTQQCSQVWVQE